MYGPAILVYEASSPSGRSVWMSSLFRMSGWTHDRSHFLLIFDQQLKLVMDSIIWAFRHTERNIAETGLNLLLAMLKNFQVLLYFVAIRLIVYVEHMWWRSNSFFSHGRILSLLTSFIGLTIWRSSKKFLLFWQILFISLGLNCMYWCYSTYFAWYVST